MSFLTRPGEGPGFSYAGQPLHVLAGQDGQPEGFAAMEIVIPAHFAGPIPHAHDEFDEAIYVLRGQLQVTGDQTLEAAAVMFTAPRGRRHRPATQIRRRGAGPESARTARPALAFSALERSVRPPAGAGHRYWATRIVAGLA